MADDVERSKDEISSDCQSIKLNTGKKALFFDDYLLDQKTNIRRVVHRPDKQGTVIEPDKWWEGGRASAFSAPFWVPEEEIYKWIYRPNYKDWTGLAISEDGVEWTKPTLGIVEFDGSVENNLVSDRRIHKVVRDPTADPERRYKGFADTTPVASPDLIEWTEMDSSGIYGGDSGSLTYDEPADRFISPVKLKDDTDETYRQFELVTSDSFHEWSSPKYLFAADETDQENAQRRIRQWLSDPGRPRPLFVDPPPEENWERAPEMPDLPKRREGWNAQVQNVSVFPYHGQYIAFLTLLYPTGAYRPEPINTSAFSMVEIAASRDLNEWNRIREPFLVPGRLDSGVIENYERMLVQPVNRPMRDGDELRIYYNGGKAHQGFEASQWTPGRYDTYLDGTERSEDSLSDLERADLEAGESAIYLATLRLDGFVSLSASEDPGTIITKPLNIGGDSIYLNCDASDGYARVDVLDRDGNRLTGAGTRTLGTDSVKVDVGSDLTNTEINNTNSRPIRIKIQLKHAQLYAIWTE